MNGLLECVNITLESIDLVPLSGLLLYNYVVKAYG